MTDLHPKLVKDLRDTSWMIESIKWDSLTEDGKGSCIPISFAVSEFLALRRRACRVAESTLRAEDSINTRWMETTPSENGFLGHAVVLVPSQKLLLDGSLWTQQSKVLANLPIARLVVAQWRPNLPTTLTQGRLKLRWEPDLQANEWKNRKWPWKQITDAVVTLEREMR